VDAINVAEITGHRLLFRDLKHAPKINLVANIIVWKLWRHCSILCLTEPL